MTEREQRLRAALKATVLALQRVAEEAELALKRAEERLAAVEAEFEDEAESL